MTFYSIRDDVTGDWLAFSADAGRLIVQSVADGRARTMIVADGVGAAAELSAALRDAFTQEVA